jgi:hypothetical protein
MDKDFSEMTNEEVARAFAELRGQPDMRAARKDAESDAHRQVIKLVDEYHHRDCIAEDIGAHLAATLECVSPEAITMLGPDVRCTSCGKSLV